MEKEAATILGDELKTLFKIILLGFISLDFLVLSHLNSSQPF
jgi:hypothetical protein